MIRKLSVFALLATLILSCSREDSEYLSFAGFTQGTTYSIIYRNSPAISIDSMRFLVEKRFREFDHSLSTWDSTSIISAINNNEHNVPDSLLLNVLNRSREIWKMSGGLFDITAGPLVNAWGFGPDARKRFDESMLDSLMNLVGMEKILVSDEGIVVKENPGMYIDVNAIAQGYSADIIGELLEGTGIDDYLVEVGGEVRTRGSKTGGESWAIGIDKPKDGNMIPGADLQTIVKLSGRSLATSGNYRKYWVEDGVKYSHTINPKTGYPVRHNLLSVTIIANDCMSADGIATACLVMGLEKASEFLLAHNEFEGYLIYSNDKGEYETWFTPGMGSYLEE